MERRSLRVSDDYDNGVATDEHLADVSLTVDWVCTLALVSLGCLGPHLTDIFHDHIHMSVESLHSPQDFAIISAVDQNLRVGLDGFSKK